MNIPSRDEQERRRRERDAVQQLLRGRGCTPWYWQSFPAIPGGTWARQGDALVLSRAGAPILQLGAFVYAEIVGERLLALWSFEGAAFQVLLYDVEELRPLERALPARRHSIRAAVLPKMELSIPRLASGAHPAPVAPLVAVDEILMLGEPLPDLGDVRPPRCAIYAWEPRRGSITVYPQVWFTAETMDLGYQWITRIARDPATERFVGGGFRIDDFELDETGTQIARRWPA